MERELIWGRSGIQVETSRRQLGKNQPGESLGWRNGFQSHQQVAGSESWGWNIVGEEKSGN